MKKVRVYSLHPTKKEAEKFAKHLTREGVEGVLVGTKTSGGYPVSSLADRSIADKVREEHRQHEKEEARKAYEISEEKYDYEGEDIPTIDLLAVFELKGEKPTFTDKEIMSITKEELSKAGLKGIKVAVGKYHGNLSHSKYADATVFYYEYPKPQYKLVLHPVCRYHTEDELRDTVKHEIGHIVKGDI